MNPINPIIPPSSTTDSMDPTDPSSILYVPPQDTKQAIEESLVQALIAAQQNQNAQNANQAASSQSGASVVIDPSTGVSIAQTAAADDVQRQRKLRNFGKVQGFGG